MSISVKWHLAKKKEERRKKKEEEEEREGRARKKREDISFLAFANGFLSPWTQVA